MWKQGGEERSDDFASARPGRTARGSDGVGESRLAETKRNRVSNHRCMHSRRPPGMFLWQACQCGCAPPCAGQSPVSWAKSVGFNSRPLALSAPSALPILVHSLVHNTPSTQLGAWDVPTCVSAPWTDVRPPSFRMGRMSDSATLALNRSIEKKSSWSPRCLIQEAFILLGHSWCSHQGS
jgi:hypothetical protein